MQPTYFSNFNAELNQVNTWCKMLKQATPDNSAAPHNLICRATEINSPRYSIRLVSPEDYQNYSAGNRDQFSSCQKLSLQEIFKTSQLYMNSSYVNLKIRMGLTSILYTADSSTSDATLISIVEETMRTVDAINKIPDLLTRMATSGAAKRLEQSNSSLLGKLLYYVSSDLTPSITKAKEGIPSKQEIFKDALEDIRDRVFINIETFEKEIGLPLAQRHDFKKQEHLEKFATPVDVRKKWLTVYAQDKYQKLVSQLAEDNRTRVFKYTKLWASIIQQLGQDATSEEERKISHSIKDDDSRDEGARSSSKGDSKQPKAAVDINAMD